MLRRRRVVVAMAVALTTGTAIAVTAGLSFGSSHGGITGTQIRSVALSAATGAGDPNPTSIEYSAPITRAQANMASSDDVIPDSSGGSAQSYLVIERGNFVVKNFQGPPGAAVPTGSVLTLVVDAANGDITDIGVQNTAPDLSQFGQATAISP